MNELTQQEHKNKLFVGTSIFSTLKVKIATCDGFAFLNGIEIVENKLLDKNQMITFDPEIGEAIKALEAEQ